MGQGVLSSSSKLSSIQALGSNSATCFLSSTAYSEITGPSENNFSIRMIEDFGGTPKDHHLPQLWQMAG